MTSQPFLIQGVDLQKFESETFPERCSYHRCFYLDRRMHPGQKHGERHQRSMFQPGFGLKAGAADRDRRYSTFPAALLSLKRRRDIYSKTLILALLVIRGCVKILPQSGHPKTMSTQLTSER